MPVSKNTPDTSQSIQWKVKWDNWTGTSEITVSDEGKLLQSRYPLAWNLVSVENIWGDRISFDYQVVEQQVGTNGLSYTKACYLSKITDMLNRIITLHYQEKEYVPTEPAGPREYLSPDWDEPYKKKPDNNPGPYQNRYKTRFLKDITVNNEQGEWLYTVFLEYDKKSNFSSYSPEDFLYGDTVKRTLTGIRRVFADGCSKPGLALMYSQAGQVNAGALHAAVLPEGEKVEYHYTQQQLPLCNRQKQIENPWPGSAKPRVWFGPDYVFTVWVNESTDQLKISLYTWLGRWRQWEPQVSIIKAPVDINRLNVITNQDFAYLTYLTVQSQKSYVHAFHKNNLIRGEWHETAPLELNSTSLATASGDNFFLACDQENRVLYRYTWDCYHKNWNKEDISGVLAGRQS